MALMRFTTSDYLMAVGFILILVAFRFAMYLPGAAYIVVTCVGLVLMAYGVISAVQRLRR